MKISVYLSILLDALRLAAAAASARYALWQAQRRHGRTCDCPHCSGLRSFLRATVGRAY